MDFHSERKKTGFGVGGDSGECATGDRMIERNTFGSDDYISGDYESHSNGFDKYPLQMSRRIFIYGMNYAPELIGVGKYTGELGSYLAAQGQDVEVVTAVPHYPGWSIKTPFQNWYSIRQTEHHRITRCPLILPRTMRGVWRMVAPLTFALSSAPVAIWRILVTRPDVVLCIEPTLLSAPAALAAAKLVGARTVLHVQDLEIDAAFAVGHLTGGWLKYLAMSFEKLITSRFQAVVTISHKMRARLQSKGVKADRCSVIRNWVDTQKIRPLTGPSQFRRELNLPEDTFIVLYAGNLGPKQALGTVIDAADQVRGRPDIVFIIAGEGPERANLVARAPPNVRFLPLQPEKRLSELLAVADVHVLPQDAGAADLVLPSKLGGMLASGKPLMVQAATDTELYNFLDGAAVIVQPGNASALATAIRFPAQDTEAIAQHRRELAEELSAAKVLPHFLRLLISNGVTE